MSGFDLDLETAARQMGEAKRLLEGARERLINAHAVNGALPGQALLAATGLITAISLVETSGAHVARVISKEKPVNPTSSHE